MTARNSRAASRRRQFHLVMGSLALAVAFGLVVTVAYFLLATGAATPDKDSFCPASGAKAHSILLVDQTDPLTFTQKQAFLEYLNEFGRGKVGEGELLSVFVLSEDIAGNAKPIFEMCNPGRGVDKNIWTANPERIRRQFETGFLKPLILLADRLEASAPSPKSPIMEMLQLIAINGYRARNVPGRRRLFVVSDMLQNTEAISQYRDPLDFPQFRDGLQYPKLRTELPGVEVELAYLLHAPQRQTRRHLKFWEDYFDAAGARIVAVRVLEG